MSLKEKLSSLATEKLVEKANGGVDGVINAALNKIGKATGQKMATEYVQNTQKNCLIIRGKSYSVGTIAGLFAGKTPDLTDCDGYYQIFDTTGTMKYRSTSKDTIMDRDIIDLYDMKGNKIGYVKEHIMSIGVPLLEKDVKRCSVYLGKEKIAVLKKYVSFGELSFETLEGKYKVTCDKGKWYKVFYGAKQIVKLNVVPVNLKNGYVDKFVIEYDDISDEVVAILLATAVDVIK